MAVAWNRQQFPGERGAFPRIEVARSPLRQQVRGEQHLEAQVVAHAGEETLVAQQAAERPPGKARIEHAYFDVSLGESAGESVRPHPRPERVRRTSVAATHAQARSRIRGCSIS